MKVPLQAAGTFQGHTAAVYALCAVGADEFLSAGGDGIVVRWNVSHPEHGSVLVKVGEPVFSIHHDPLRNALLIGTGTGRLLLIDLASQREVQVEQAHQKGIFCIVAHTPHGFVCAGGDGAISSWRWSSAGTLRVERERFITLCEEKLRDVTVSNDGTRLVVACGDGSWRELATNHFSENIRSTQQDKGLNAVLFHPNKPVLLSGGKDGELKAWRVDGTLIHAVPVHKGSVYVVTADPEGRWLITAGRDALVKVWDASTLDPVQRSSRDRSGHTHSVNAAVWCGTTLITASDDRRIHSWKLAE